MKDPLIMALVLDFLSLWIGFPEIGAVFEPANYNNYGLWYLQL